MTSTKITSKSPQNKSNESLGTTGQLEDFIPYKLSVVANRLSQSVGRLFEKQFNIQIPEWRILMVLYAYKRLVFTVVVERTSMDKARVSRAQRRLVDLGLVTSVIDTTDGRRVILSITQAGTKMCQQIIPHATSVESWYLAALTSEERFQLDHILDKLMMRSVDPRD